MPTLKPKRKQNLSNKKPSDDGFFLFQKIAWFDRVLTFTLLKDYQLSEKKIINYQEKKIINYEKKSLKNRMIKKLYRFHIW